MRRYVENARTVELFERGLGCLPSGKHCGLGQNRLSARASPAVPFNGGNRFETS